MVFGLVVIGTMVLAAVVTYAWCIVKMAGLIIWGIKATRRYPLPKEEK